MTSTYSVRPIAFVRNIRRDAIDDGWDGVESTIEIDASIMQDTALAGLDVFSHAEIVFLFHKVDPEAVDCGSRRPRGRTDWPEVGILAQRGKDRPNRIGTKMCSIQSVDGTAFVVRGLDAIDGTPVLDIKPVMSGFLPRGEIKEPHWAKEIMSSYW